MHMRATTALTVWFRSPAPCGRPLQGGGAPGLAWPCCWCCSCLAANPRRSQVLLEPSEALSSVLADEAVQLAGTKKQIALITPDASWGPPSTVEESLKRR